MANDLAVTTTDPAAQSKAVASFASSTSWTIDQAMSLADGLDMERLIAGYERGLQPLSETEPDGKSPFDPDIDGKLCLALGDALAMICTKIAPTISVEQSKGWITVMQLALSDLPGRVAIEAAQAALHVPMRFLNEVEGVMREKAEAITSRRRGALWRLRQLRDAMEAARSPAPALGADEPDRPLTEAERAHLATNPWGLGDLAVKLGMIEADAVRSSSVIR